MQQQGANPDLTPASLAAWLPWLLVVLSSGWGAYQTWKVGKKKLADDRQREIHESVANALETARTWEQLADGRQQKIVEAERERDAYRDKCGSLEKRLEERLSIEDRLQKEVFRLQGEFDDMNERVRRLEGEKSARR